MLSHDDIVHITRTLELAERGRYGARPNPVVGAVLATPSAVLAEGYHARRGEPHAERACLDAFPGDVPPNATMYVSLEPCAHTGKQPPCTDLLIARGIRRVVIACADPNPVTHGHGPARLAAAGVRVVWAPSAIAERATMQNAGFQSVHRTGRPFVTGKWAVTSDWKVATGDPERRWISSAESLEMVQYLRAASDAVIVGIGTVLADDPRLTVRGLARERMVAPAPVRVVLDRSLRTPTQSKLVRSARETPVLIVCDAHFAAHGVGAHRRRVLKRAGCEVMTVPHLDLDDAGRLGHILTRLARRGCNDVLLESGPQLAASMFDAHMVDRVVLVQADVVSAPGSDVAGFAPDHPLRRFDGYAADRASHEMLGGDDVREFDLTTFEPAAHN